MLWLQFLFWKVQIIQRNLLIKLIVCQGNIPDGQFSRFNKSEDKNSPSS